jgi:hypothetical protein
VGLNCTIYWKAKGKKGHKRDEKNNKFVKIGEIGFPLKEGTERRENKIDMKIRLHFSMNEGMKKRERRYARQPSVMTTISLLHTSITFDCFPGIHMRERRKRNLCVVY